MSIDAARPARVAPSHRRTSAARLKGQTRRAAFGALAPASTALENGRSKVVFSCHKNSLPGLFATTPNNLALRGYPICRTPSKGARQSICRSLWSQQTWDFRCLRRSFTTSPHRASVGADIR
ncbi:MAG: hypothetical protein LUH46_02020 [Alistipes sp.]|nr:hypothetical protein [Alistipes sp.]